MGLNQVFYTYGGTTSSSGTSRAARTTFTLRVGARGSGSGVHPEYSQQMHPEFTQVHLPSLLVSPAPRLLTQNGRTSLPAEPCPGLLGKVCFREEGGEAATSPCHQWHQRGQEDQWGQSDLGRHLCQENHQHL